MVEQVVRSPRGDPGTRHRDLLIGTTACGGIGVLLALLLSAALASNAQAQGTRVGLGTGESFAVLGGAARSPTPGRA